MGNSHDGSAAWCSGGIRRLYGVLMVLLCHTAGGTDMSYAGPDRTETLPHYDAGRQFCVACENSHLVCPRSFPEMRMHQDAARLGSSAFAGRRQLSCSHHPLTNRGQMGQVGSDVPVLQHFGHQRRDLGPLGPGERDMREERMTLQLLHHGHDTVIPADPEVVPLGHVMSQNNP